MRASGAGAHPPRRPSRPARRRASGRRSSSSSAPTPSRRCARCRSMRCTTSSAGLGRPGTAAAAAATTVPVGAMIRLAPSSVDVAWVPAWFACEPPLAVGRARRRDAGGPRRRRLHLARAGGEHQAGAAQRQRPGHLGEVAVEADDEADPPERRVVERREAVTGREHGVLERGTVEVRLAVPGGEVAVGIEDQRRVVDRAVLTELGHAARDEEAVSPRPLREARRSWPVPRLGVPPCVVGQASRGRSRTTTARAGRAARRRVPPRRRSCPGRQKGSASARPVWTATAPRRPEGLASHPHQARRLLSSSPACTVRAQRSGSVSRL